MVTFQVPEFVALLATPAREAREFAADGLIVLYCVVQAS
jgi:hypothetical protein